MKRLGVVLLAVVFVLSIASIALAAEKFAFADIRRIFSEYEKTKKYDKDLEEKGNAYTAERDKKVNDIKQFQDKMNVLSDKAKEEKKPELETKVKALQEFDRQRQTDLRKEQDEKMKEIVKDIDDVVKQYSEKEKFTFVFSDTALVYKDKTLDITDKIIGQLNKTKK